MSASSSLQNMAPNMQRALLVSGALFALAAVVYMFCIQPAQLSLQRGRSELDSLRSRQEREMRDIRGVQETKARLERIQSERQRYMDALLKPLLESYAMRAKSILDPLAAEAGVTVQDYQEQPRRLLPLTKPAAPQLYARQPVRLICRGSYAALVSFMLRVEKMLPLVSLQALSFKAQNNPDAQTAEIVFEWPILGVNTAQQKKGAKK